jgi:hypothetical protein
LRLMLVIKLGFLASFYLEKLQKQIRIRHRIDAGQVSNIHQVAF